MCARVNWCVCSCVFVCVYECLCAFFDGSAGQEKEYLKRDLMSVDRQMKVCLRQHRLQVILDCKERVITSRLILLMWVSRCLPVCVCELDSRDGVGQTIIVNIDCFL